MSPKAGMDILGNVTLFLVSEMGKFWAQQQPGEAQEGRRGTSLGLWKAL